MTHDQLQAAAFQWAHNTYPQIRGSLFAVLNEIKKLPCETRQQHMIRVQQAKAIGLRPGGLDLLLLAPSFEYLGPGPFSRHELLHVPAAPYAFDAKMDGDKLSEKQLDFIKMLRLCGGDGWEFRSLPDFQCIFNLIIIRHYGPIN